MDIIAIGMPGGPEIIILFFLFIIALPFIALVDVVRSNFKDGTTKLIWVIVILFAPFLGPLLYFAVGRNQKVEKRHFNLNKD